MSNSIMSFIKNNAIIKALRYILGVIYMVPIIAFMIIGSLAVLIIEIVVPFVFVLLILLSLLWPLWFLL